MKAGTPNAVDDALMELDPGLYYLSASQVADMVEMDVVHQHVGQALSHLSTHDSVEYTVSKWGRGVHPNWEIRRYDLTE